MAILTEKYIRKPLYVDVVTVTAENFNEVAQWCQGEIRRNDTDEPVYAAKESPGEDATDQTLDPTNLHIRIRVHNPRNARQTKAMIGDKILYTDRGYKVYTQKAFVNSFDPA